jgi:uncharacterized protein
MKAAGWWKNLRPDCFVDAIYRIDGDWLAARNIRGLILDIDNTLLARDAREPHERLRAWVASIQQSGVKMLILSNNWSGRVKDIARDLRLPLLAPAAKPLAPGFKRAMAHLGVAPAETAVVGDQLFTDILGGNRAGVLTILVTPVSDVDLVHTKMLRVVERLLLSRFGDAALAEARRRERA